MIRKPALISFVIAALMIAQSGCRVVPANSNKTSGTSNSKSTSDGGFVLGALVAIGGLIWLSDDDDDHDCKCKDDDTGIKITFD